MKIKWQASLLILFLSVLNLSCKNTSTEPSTLNVVIARAFEPLQFSRPVDMQQEPVTSGEGRWFIVEQAGQIKVFDPAKTNVSPSVFLNITDRVEVDGAEQGLLGLALDPQFAANHTFYVYYTAKPRGDVTVSRFTANDLRISADTASEEKLLTIDHSRFKNHDGGHLVFGPDGYLYIGTGDGGGGGDPLHNGQALNALLAKLLRIDVHKRDGDKPYGIPVDNPFINNTDARPEIYAYGLRNPWRYSFDRKTNELWLADVGQDRIEEIDLIEKGKNYGWSVMEGSSCFRPDANCDQTNLQLPVFEYGHDVGKCITGGFVYRGKNVPALEGYYIYGDFVTTRIWALKRNVDGKMENVLIEKSGHNISSFGEGNNGELYFLDYGSGQIFALTN